MKLHLNKALMSVVLGAAVQVAGAAAVTVTPDVVVNNGADLSAALTGKSNATVVLDVVDKGETSLSGTVSTTSRLDVREGTLNVGGNLTINHSNPDGNTTNSIQVSGSGATLNIENGTVIAKGGHGFVNVGGSDGKGTLNMKNATLDANVSLVAGYNDGAYWEHIVPSTTVAPDSSVEYTAGEFDVVTAPAGRAFGTATINMDKSVAKFGSAIFIGEADVTLTNGSRMEVGHANISTDAHSIADRANNQKAGCNFLGRQSGSTTELNIESGSKLDIVGSLFTGSITSTNTKAVVNIDGEKSSLQTSQAIGFGYGHAGDAAGVKCSETIVSLTNGGSMVSETILFGVQVAESKGLHTVDVDVEKAASITAKDIVISNGADVTVKDGSLAFSTLTMNGGALTLDDAAMLTINVTKAAGTAITLDGDAAQLNFAANTIKLVFDELLSVANPSVQLTWELISGIGENDDVNLEDLKILSGTDYVSLSNVNVEKTDGKVVLTATASIPEPTTATLSLLALAALASRRRRK
ncbi:MAG: hypothetical protein IKZ10_02630 [Akkermansia sp.]|nr:hypothetical protein [Akkermansia sp.]